MAIQVKDFENMVIDTLNRITASSDITNINAGSVVRTIVESVLSEVDLQYYQLYRLYQSMNIDTAIGDDLDRSIRIFGISRNNATKCAANIVFGRSSPSAYDINIPINTIVSTRIDSNKQIVEFVVAVDGAKLPAGDLTVSVPCIARVARNIYLPPNTVVIMNNPVIGIEYITNPIIIYGGTDIETDTELRARAKNTLSLFGKGTAQSIETAVKQIDGIVNAICTDSTGTNGMFDLVIVPEIIPVSSELQAQVLDIASKTKSAGIKMNVIYPTLLSVNISINTVGFTDANTIRSGIVDYINTLSVGNPLIINQMERFILNKCNSPSMDITTSAPASNVTATNSQIIRYGTITVNGVVVNG